MYMQKFVFLNQCFVIGENVQADRGKRFAVVCALWLHRNEVVFEGKAVSSEGIIHEVEKFVCFWFEDGSVGGYGGHDGPCSWSRYPLPPLYGCSPLCVICCLIQKKKCCDFCLLFCFKIISDFRYIIIASTLCHNKARLLS